MSDVLGMGVTVQLRDMFTSASRRIASSSRSLRGTLSNDAKAVNQAWSAVRLGDRMMFFGGAGLGAITAIGYAAVKASSDLEVFLKRYIVMMGSEEKAKKLFNTLKLFSAETPFTIPEVMAGARNLLAFGMSADKVTAALKPLGDLASGTGKNFDWVTTVIGRVQSGAFGRAMNALRSMSIDPMKLVDDKGKSVLDAKGRTRRDLSPDQLVDSILRLAEQKFPNMMHTMMGTLPGQLSNIKDKIILMLGAIGDRFKSGVFNLVKYLNDMLSPDKIVHFAHAIGDGFLLLLRVILAVAAPAMWLLKILVDMSESHPGIMKVVVVTMALASALLFAAGAALAFAGGLKLAQLTGFTGWITSFTSYLVTMAGPLSLVAVLLAGLYFAWSGNFMGMQDRLKSFWNTTKQIVSGVIELFSSIKDGVGYMSTATFDALEKAGLTKWVVMLFMFGYRIYKLFSGMAVGIQVAFQALGWVLAPVVDLLSLVASWALKITSLLGFGANLIDVDIWKTLGFFLGLVAAALILNKTLLLATEGAMVLVKLAQWAWTAAVWLWEGAALAAQVASWGWAAANAALDATIGIGLGLTLAWIAVIALLVVEFIYARRHWQELQEGMASGSTSQKAMWNFLAPWLTIPLQWNEIKEGFMAMVHTVEEWGLRGANFIGNIWDKTIKRILDGIQMVMKMVPDWAAASTGTLALKRLSAGDNSFQGVTGVKHYTTPEEKEAAAHALHLRHVQFQKEIKGLLDGLHNAVELQKLHQTQAKEGKVAPIQLTLDGRVIAEYMARIETERHARGLD